MSDAAKPTMNSDEPQPNIPAQVDTSSTEAADGEKIIAAQRNAAGEWQTVNFPGVMDVQAILAVESAGLSEQSAPLLSGSSSSDRLQRENAQLHSLVAQLQEDLSQAQIELQLEVARFYCKDEDGINGDRPREHLAAVQPQIESQQQALIDRLTTQLEASQRRIAQLERDCVLSQQRYNEQVQIVSQAENTCRDLRMRLHRQQQQTLQFKAALEKSVEMNAVVESVQATELTIVAPDSTDATAQAFIPKARPVQPWSIAPGSPTPRLFSISRPQPSHLPNRSPQKDESIAQPPSEAAIEPAFTESVAVSASPTLSQLNDRAIDVLFPTGPAAAAPAIAPASSAELVFDLSPFIEAGEVDSDNITVANASDAEVVHLPVKQPASAQAPISPFQQSESLWTDLARLIEPDSVSEEPQTATKDVPEAIQLRRHPSDSSDASVDVQLTARSAFNLQPISLVDFAASEVGTSVRPTAENPPSIMLNPFPSFDLHGSTDAAIDPEAVTRSTSDESDADIPARCPSPLLYPFRQPKKLPSMAAVDLPSFPR